MSRLHIKLVCEDLGENEKIAGNSMDSQAVEYANGALVWEDFFEGEEDKIQSLGMAPFTANDEAFTFVEYYADEACNQIVSWPIAWSEDDQVIYAKYIEGSWEILKNTEDVKSKLFKSTKVKATDRFYLVQDIDCVGVSVAPFEEFKGELQGNGFKLSNLKVTLARTSVRLKSGQPLALFGNITSSAIIQNIEWKDIAVEYTTTPYWNVSCYFLFAKMQEGAVVNDVKISGSFRFAHEEGNKKPENIEEDWQYGTVENGADISGFDISGVSAPTFEL